MNSKFKLTILLIFFINYCAFSQSKEEVVQSIRERYYRVNGSNVSLNKMYLDNSEYYFENNKLAIIKVKENEDKETGIFEFYFDRNRDGDYYPYFIYFNPDNKELVSEKRLYFNEDNECVLFKENQEEVEFEPWKSTNNKYFIKSMNSLNILQNICMESMNNREKKISEIDETIKRIEGSIIQKDTIENVIEEESYYSHFVIQFKDKDGEVVKKQENSGSDHELSEKFTYFDKWGKIYTIEKSIVTFQNSRFRTEINYYFIRNKIKSIEYDSYGVFISKEYNDKMGWVFDFKDFVPKISYYNCE